MLVQTCSFNNIFKEKKGFTLVELLMVIVVLVTLLAIGIPSYILITSRARETATETEMYNIAKALEIYITDNRAYPAEGDFPNALKVSGIMTDISGNDTWGNAYQYTSPNGTSYILKSYGINKIDGGNDDIVFDNGIMTEDGAYFNK